MQEWAVVFWDVGQGDATSIRLPDGSYILIDAGPSLKAGNPLPGWFSRMGHPVIRMAITTHSHVDHFGGLISLCRETPQQIDEIVVLRDFAFYQRPELRTSDFESFLQALKSRRDTGRTKLFAIDRAQVLYHANGLQLRVMHPLGMDNEKNLPADLNKTSMIILLEKAGNSEVSPLIIFGGDAPLAALKATSESTHPAILTGPHHGHPQCTGKCKTPEYWRFFRDSLHPENIFISVGRNNGYKLPDANYIKGAACCGVCVNCSQLSVKCDPERKKDVFEGSAFCGVDKPVGSVQCRGAMRVYVSSEGVRFDEDQRDFRREIEKIYPNAPCKCGSLKC